MTEVEFSRIISLDDLKSKTVVRDLQATPEECEKLAVRLNLLKVESLKAHVEAYREASGIIVVEGQLEAKIEQECVRTLEPLSTFIRAPFEIRFITPQKYKHYMQEHDIHAIDAPDLLEEDFLDLGEIVAQTLSLEIDPYLTKDGKNQ